MKRIRGESGSAVTILEPTQGRRRNLDVPKRLLVNFDVRVLLDRLRLEIGAALRAGASEQLARMYSLGPITGSSVRARTWVRDESRSASGYFAARFPVVAPEIIARETERWMIESCPASEPLPKADVSGRPLGSSYRPEQHGPKAPPKQGPRKPAKQGPKQQT
jgi:hypothetical protein